jgi:hypothetical protein
MTERTRAEEQAEQLMNSSDESVEALMADNEIDLGDDELEDLDSGVDELNFDPDESLDSGSGSFGEDLE